MTSDVNVIRELRGSTGNPGFGPATRIHQFNLQTGQGSADRCHCPAFETMDGFNKSTKGKAFGI